MATMTSTQPYLFRAILEWIEDNSMTPHIVVDALGAGVLVPQEYVKDGQIILNISSSSIELYQMDNKVLHFSARFNGVSQEITVPMNFILGVYSRENGQGMYFDPAEYSSESQDAVDDSNANPSATDVEVVSTNTLAGNKSEKNSEKKLDPKRTDKKSKKDVKRKNSHLTIIK